MNKDIKQQWVNALTSGEYSQTGGALAKINQDDSVSYCCLGVLCDLAVKAGVIDEPGQQEPDSNRLAFDYEEAILPVSVQEWAGVDDRGNEPNGPDLGLPSKNDAGKSFNVIAQIIEDRL